MDPSHKKGETQSIDTIAGEEIWNATDREEITYLETMREKDPFAQYILAQSKLAIESYLKELSPQEKTNLQDIWANLYLPNPKKQ